MKGRLVCNKCKKNYDITNDYKRKCWCHDCYKNHLRKHYRNNKNKYRSYRKNNKSFYEYQKEYKKKYIGKRKEYFKQYYIKNKGKKNVTNNELKCNMATLQDDIEKYERIIYLVGILGHKKYMNPLLFSSDEEYNEYVKYVDNNIANNF